MMAKTLRSFKEANQLVKGMSRRMGNLRPVMNAMTPIFTDRVNRYFEQSSSAGADGGNRWADLSDVTADAIVRGSERGFGHPLIVSGALRASVQAQVNRKTQLELGTAHTKKNKPVGLFHQEGGKRGKPPKRVFLAFHPRDIQTFSNAANEYIYAGTLFGKRVFLRGGRFQ